MPLEEEGGDDGNSQSRKPKLTEILDQKVEIGSSSSSMMDAMNVHRNLEHFPILAFSNEPVSHLASNTVRKALDTVPDELHRSGEVDEELHTAYLDQSAYDHSVPQGRAALSLSLPIDLATVVVNDGDGIILGVDPSMNTPLDNATYTRLNRIDAPELYAVHYLKNEDTGQVIKQFKGHWSLLGVQFFLDLFVRKGTAQFHYQLPRFGRAEPKDYYGRPLKEYWFKFLRRPSDRELRILDAVILNCDGLEADETEVLMSSADPRLATPERPFYLSLNALLVLSGHCHVFTRFCHDKRMLRLQRVAKENQIGPLYCGLSKNHVIGSAVDTSEDVDLSQFATVDVERLRLQGYPDWIMGENRIVGLLPWHERALKKKVYSFTRQMATTHLNTPRSSTSAVYGVYIDIDRFVTGWPFAFLKGERET